MARTIFRLLAAAFVTVSLVSAQEPEFTLKVNVPLVTVDVTVQDAAGNLITDLPREDFEVYEDGIRQDIRYFLPVSAPESILLLFDRSGSTQDKWPLMQRAVAEFVTRLRSQDQIAIATFDYDFQVQQQWTRDRQKALLTLPKLLEGERIGGTNFYGSVEHALRREFRKISGRRALIVLTDGRETAFYKDIVDHNRLLGPKEERGFQGILKAARTSHIPIYFVAFNTDRNLQPNTVGGDEYRSLKLIFRNSDVADQYLAGVRLRMEQLADVSGGQILYPERLQDIVSLYQKIGQELGTSYSLGYSPANADGLFHRIEVRLADSSLRIIQSRNGYDAK